MLTAVPLVLVVLSAPQASPDPLAEARRLYAGLEYNEARSAIQAALASQSVPTESLSEAFWMLGSCAAILGDTSAADQAFRQLLAQNPSFSLPAATSPRIRVVFEKTVATLAAEAEAAKRARLEQMRSEIHVDDKTPYSAVAGRPLAFGFEVSDPKGYLQSGTLSYRRAGQTDFTIAALAKPPEPRGLWSLELSEEQTANDGPFAIEYAAQFLGSTLEPLADIGSTSRPKSIALDADTDGWASNPWIWVAAGFVVAGATVGVVAMSGSSLPESDLGTVELP